MGESEWDCAPPSSVWGSRGCVLAINGGSSSLKFAAFPADRIIRAFLSGRIERIGRGEARLTVTDDEGDRSESVPVEAPDLATAAEHVIGRVRNAWRLPHVAGIGHRVVHGGGRFAGAEVVSEQMVEGLRELSPLDPDHLPGEVALIEAFRAAFPTVPQVACFDTAFHRDLPRVARVVPIPRRYEALGVRRYGFHGLSYAYLMEELARVAGPAEADGRVILAHLGSGASLAAVRGGRCVDTTMGFTPASGLVMGTRSGDLDPGLVAFLAHAEGMTPEQFHRMTNEESGLLGVSETSSDVRDLLARSEADSRAAEAIDLFCYRVRAAIGGLCAALGGLDALVFSGGVGENAPEVRRRACEGLGFLGVELDDGRNAAGGPLISAESSPVRVRVIRTDEEAMIARETIRLALASS